MHRIVQEIQDAPPTGQDVPPRFQNTPENILTVTLLLLFHADRFGGFYLPPLPQARIAREQTPQGRITEYPRFPPPPYV